MGGRFGVLLCLAALAGCAAAPVPAARVVDTVEPSADPYAMDASPRDGKRVTRTLERVPDWSDARHVRAIEGFMDWFEPLRARLLGRRRDARASFGVDPGAGVGDFPMPQEFF